MDLNESNLEIKNLRHINVRPKPQINIQNEHFYIIWASVGLILLDTNVLGSKIA